MNKVYDIERLISYFTIVSVGDRIPEEIRLQSEEICRDLIRNQFILIQGHNIPIELIEQAFETSKHFFHESLTVKLTQISKDKARRGYCPSNQENFASLIGEIQKPNDLVEKFRMGPIITEDIKLIDEYYNSKEGRIHFYPNNWLNRRMEQNISEYYQKISELSIILLKTIEIGINLSTNYLSESMDKHTSILSLNYYESIVNTEDNIDMMEKRKVDSNRMIRVAKHTDVSLLTIIAQYFDRRDSIMLNDGLELLSHAMDEESKDRTNMISNVNTNTISNHPVETWDIIHSDPNILIVHVGDCLEDWSGGIFKSAIHRVISSIDPIMACDRYSLAYFVSPNYDTSMIPFDKNKEEVSDESRYPSYAKWRKNHIQKAVRIQKNSNHGL